MPPAPSPSRRTSLPDPTCAKATDGLADSSGDEALKPFILESDSDSDSDSDDTPLILICATRYTQAPKSLPSDFRPTNPAVGPSAQKTLMKPPNEDVNIKSTGVVGSKQLLADDNERAANARELLRNISWSGGEQSLKSAVPSPTTAIVPPPRSALTRRVSPSDAPPSIGLDKPNSSTIGDDVQTALPSQKKIPAAVEPAAKTSASQSGLHSTSYSEPSSDSELSSLPSSPPPLPDRGHENQNQIKRLKSLVAAPATEPDETGQYESACCHQCRIKTTRPKMMCDQSHDPKCIVRICQACLMTRAVYDHIPELRPPRFEFVPGGRMLCVKCRGICPCATCRRRRGEDVESRRGYKDFHVLTTSEAAIRQKTVLMNKSQNQENGKKLKKISRSYPEDLAPIGDDRPLAATTGPKAPKRIKIHMKHVLDDIVCLDQSPTFSAVDRSQAASPAFKRPILSAESGGAPTTIHIQPRPATVDPGPSTTSNIGNGAVPKPGRGRPRKDASSLSNPTPSKAGKGKNQEMDKTIVNQLLQSNNRLAEAASGMASILHNNNNNNSSLESMIIATPEYARLERSEKQLQLKIREIEEKNAADEAEKQKAKTAEGFERAKMMQDFLKSGLSFEKSMEATMTFLGPPNSLRRYWSLVLCN
ncbi:hypothetical protein Pst134EA_030302 [Puccinia striiformis f. sp. tritici]|uniref:hypothetical protein n=1 Tax=Puccinia striiformis f. sp. tritici TaxID=168172 RepID=UPI002008DDEF|nr:hypothetical protein Pst134EA_030302 [Puccinia striiformis f. sp. tritici]KAH9446382.1 hypothetical protein Pst134EA_030302 [Puccinia striiformis f. sp. tritici]